ncbi:hypothetical protein V5F32_00735 [Xanthobacter oligotrophicus]|uniref:Uncharacterized protein n=1 Tax=Xanthobacter oligotrophicus TaxID=2607286 RepID=A0ABW6ZS49_9HYPH
MAKFVFDLRWGPEFAEPISIERHEADTESEVLAVIDASVAALTVGDAAWTSSDWYRDAVAVATGHADASGWGILVGHTTRDGSEISLWVYGAAA